MADTKKIIVNIPNSLFKEVHMKKGYLEMSQINIRLSELGLAQDIRELCIYEMNLTGCEKK